MPLVAQILHSAAEEGPAPARNNAYTLPDELHRRRPRGAACAVWRQARLMPPIRSPARPKARPEPEAQRRGTTRLPPLNLFRAFDAVVRHRSFRLAADELCVTPSAVSQQIKQLEDFLDTRLFRRLPRRIELTREGQALASTVKDALAILSAGCARLADPTGPAVVSINVTATLGTRWLVSRLKRFTDEHPNIKISLLTSNEPLDFERQDVDLGIRWGTGPFPGVRAEPLAPTRQPDGIFPVCNPGFIDHRRIRRPEDLLRYTLLQAIQNGVTWATWFDRAGVSRTLPPADMLYYDDTNIMLEAVACGQGIGLSNAFLAESDLRGGRLVRLFDFDTAIDEAYYLLSSKVQRDKPAIALVREWLQREAALSVAFVSGHVVPSSEAPRP